MALLKASITCSLFWAFVRTDMMTCPMCTRATVPCGFPKAPRIPVWSLERRNKTVKITSGEKKRKKEMGRKKKKKKNPHMYTFPVVVRFCLNGPLKDPALHKLGSYTTKDALSAAFAHQSSIGNQAGRLNKLQLVVLCLTKLTYQLRHRTTFC